MKTISFLLSLIVCSLFLSACGKKFEISQEQASSLILRYRSADCIKSSQMYLPSINYTFFGGPELTNAISYSKHFTYWFFSEADQGNSKFRYKQDSKGQFWEYIDNGQPQTMRFNFRSYMINGQVLVLVSGNFCAQSIAQVNVLDISYLDADKKSARVTFVEQLQPSIASKFLSASPVVSELLKSGGSNSMYFLMNPGDALSATSSDEHTAILQRLDSIGWRVDEIE